MSKSLDTLFGNWGDYDMSFEDEESVCPMASWSTFQDAKNDNFPFGLRSSFKAKTRPKSAANVPEALPSLPLDTQFEPHGHSGNKGAADEQKFYSPSPLCFGEAEAIANGAQTAFQHVRPSPVDRIGSELELSCATEDDEESRRAVRSGKANDGKWEGVLHLVKDLNTRFTGSKTGSDIAETKNVQSRQKMAEEIMISLSAIHQNVEKIKAIVPSMANHEAKFNVLVQRQCSAAAGAVKLMAQLGDAAVAIGKDIQRQLDAARDAASSESCQSNGKCNDNSTNLPNISHVLSVLREDAREDDKLANSLGMTDSEPPTYPSDSIAPGSQSLTVKPVSEAPYNAAPATYSMPATSAFEFPVTESEYASSLVADLFGPSDRLTGVDGLANPSNIATSGIRFSLEQWEKDLGDVIRNDYSDSQLMSGESMFESPGELSLSLSRAAVTQIKSDDLIFDSLGEPSPSSAAWGEADAEPTLDDASEDSALDESDEAGDTETSDQLPAGSFTLVEVDDVEILTEQTHYCNICSKGFKRDANLRMHMRSHGGKYKSSTTWGRVERAPRQAQETVGGESTRYSCPHVGCTRNMKHPKFQPLKTMLCLKNHYRRSHCAKTLQCGKCKSKQFSVVADLKTHEKHCGSADRWACSCGTTFSRKEKLHGHIRLFVGHVPVDISTRGSSN